jgi:hypothetical protein
MPRWVALPVLALLLVGGVVGVQLGNGGGRFEPLRTADPCAERVVVSEADGIDGLTERLVLLGLDGAACRLGTSREALTLDLAQGGEPTDAEVEALRDGLQDAVERLADDDTLPAASELADEALDQAELNALLEAALRLLPDALVDGALETDEVLARAIDDLDLRAVLDDLDDRAALEQQVEEAIVQAVQDVLVDQVHDLL